jgi:hypothetical protein
MIKYAENFYTNKKFKKEFMRLVERAAVSDEIVEWDEGHLEVPYYRDIENSFDRLKIEDRKNQIYFDNMLDSYHSLVEATVRLDTLGKEKLFASEWVMLSALSLIIALSVLFLDITHLFFQIIVLIFPAVITLAFSIVYDLNTLLWSKEVVSLEPNERLFDAIGVKRFYLKKKKKFISSRIKEYRTEDDLAPGLKQIYNDIVKTRSP